MHWMRMPYTANGKWFSGLTILAIIMSTTACDVTQIDDPADLADTFGLIVNSDTSSNLLGGLRQENGQSVYLYGQFADDGSIQEVEEIVYQDEDGKVSSLKFESGRPSRALMHDGSTIDITYEIVESDRLKGQVDIVVASNGQQYVAPFDIDLQATAAQLAQIVDDVTGGAIQVSSDENTTGAARPIDAASAGKQGKKQLGVVAVAVIAALVTATGFLITASMSQIMAQMSEFVSETIMGVMIVIFLPFIIMGEICRSAILRPQFTIDLEDQSIEVEIPHRQQ